MFSSPCFSQVERREHFRLTKAAQFVDRRLQQDLRRAQRLVESLDEQDGRPRSVMWPEEEETLEDAVSEFPGGRSSESCETGGENDVDRTMASTELAVIAARSSDGGDEGGGNGRKEDGLGPEGGLREEWDLMTAEEKVSCRRMCR